jgi:tetratricopeptide (TPR) repeat protein
MARSRNRRETNADHAETYREEARDLYIRSGAQKEIDKHTLREALAKANRALLLAPDDYGTLVLIANICSDFGDTESDARAVECYDRAIMLRPDLPDAYADKASTLLQLQKAHDAVPLAEEAVRLSLVNGCEPDRLELTYMSLIEALIEERRFAEARSIIRQASEKCPSDLFAARVEEYRRWSTAEESKKDR